MRRVSATDTSIKIHVGEPDIASDPRASLTADTRNSVFKGQGPGGKNSGVGACRAVVAERV